MKTKRHKGESLEAFKARRKVANKNRRKREKDRIKEINEKS